MVVSVMAPETAETLFATAEESFIRTRTPTSASPLPVFEQERLAETRQRARSSLSWRTLANGGIPLVAMAGACAALWLLFPPVHLRPVAIVCASATLVFALLVRFETPRGFTTAAQLAFVPMMFVIPPALLVPAVCLAIALAWVPRLVSGAVSPWRLLEVPKNAWFAVGPAWALALLSADHRSTHQATIVLLLAALGAQFVGDFLVSSASLWFTMGVGWKENFSDAWIYGVDLAMSSVAFAVAVLAAHSDFAPLLVMPMAGLLAYFAHERTRRLEQMIELNETYHGTAMLLGEVIGDDDEYTGIHSQEVVKLAVAVADELGLSPDQRRNTEFAALLHDVGKIAIPKGIINKPGKLTAEEWAVMQTHSEEGERMLSRIGGFMKDVGCVVRSHHERWDGGGYPDNLIGAQAPIEARIITVCDSWNAMRTNRPYRQALSLEAAMDEIIANTNTQFDPDVAAALMRVVKRDRAPLT
jgi:putative nucleotidyltransferase with HDIG domain